MVGAGYSCDYFELSITLEKRPASYQTGAEKEIKVKRVPEALVANSRTGKRIALAIH